MREQSTSSGGEAVPFPDHRKRICCKKGPSGGVQPPYSYRTTGVQHRSPAYTHSELYSCTLPSRSYSPFSRASAPFLGVAALAVCRVLTASLLHRGGSRPTPALQASFSHLVIKLFLAAPLSGFPSLPTAFGAQASSLHFFTKLVFAAPVSGLPSFPTALVSQVAWASAEVVEKQTKRVIRANCLIGYLHRISCRSNKRVVRWSDAGTSDL